MSLGTMIKMVAALALALSPWFGSRENRPEVGSEIPSFVLVESASEEPISIAELLKQPPLDAPLLVAFLHKDKELCIRFLKELSEQVESFKQSGQNCSVLLIFSGKEQSGPAITAARNLPAPFRVLWDTDRSAYRAMGLIAFPTVCLVDRNDSSILVLKRGYRISLAQEMADALRVALGLLSEEELARRNAPRQELSEEERRRRSRLRLAGREMKQGRAEDALELFEEVLREQPTEIKAIVGRALALHHLNQDALEALLAAKELAPENHDLALALADEFLKEDRLEEVESLIQEAMAARPARALFLLGAVHERRGEWRAAAEAYRESARLLLR